MRNFFILGKALMAMKTDHARFDLSAGLVYAGRSVINKGNDDKVKRPVRVGLISLGCAKNLVDAEIMLGSLMKGGLEITNDAAQADVVIVNTCSFIDSAQEESVDAILQSAELCDEVAQVQSSRSKI